ncbi:hypothetical protein MMC30_004418 [Trapelia coarctata]|nr:hypothetical protein [Trapelia coarctata]
MGNAQSQSQRENIEARRRERHLEQQTNPVRVPGSSQDKRQRGPDSQFEPSGPPGDPNYIPVSNLNFPPRLPLPIQEEVYTPGSPIITPADITSVLNEDGDVDGALVRRTSLLSHTTADDDEIDDDLQAYGLEGARGGTVPTRIEWKQGGDRVYITGTFASWSRKYRMHRDPTTNVLSTVLDLPPGTHHVKFIVDGELQLSNELPTAVDYTNILVNYIEVSADDIPRDPALEDKVPEGTHPPQVLPPGVETKDHEPGAMGKTPTEGEEPSEPLLYGDDVPPYLLDLDREETTRKFQRAANHVNDVPVPPSLPLFLGKSILNGTTPMKDDSSVLNMPNHTVLNHLATSSIKAEVLATSLTTRYKRKYVTTIMYRPTNAEDE